MNTVAMVVVLRDDVPRSRMEALAGARGWRRTGQTDRAHLVMAGTQWTPSPGTTVAYIEDHTGGVRFVRIEGDAAQVEALASAVREALPHHTTQALLAAAASAEPAALILLAGRLAACRPEAFDRAHLAALQRLLEHGNVSVRRAAIRSAYRCRWPELTELIRRRAQIDERLRPQLQQLAAFLSQ